MFATGGVAFCGHQSVHFCMPWRIAPPYKCEGRSDQARSDQYPMTAQFKAQGMRLASVDEVAQMIEKGAERSLPLVYESGKWKCIMLIIRHLPNVIFNRMKS